MQPAKLIIAGSLLANVALGIAVWQRPNLAPSEPSNGSAPTPIAARATDDRSASTRIPRPTLWNSSSTDSFDDKLNRLRAAGASPHELRAVVEAHFADKIGKLHADLFKVATREYWQAGADGPPREAYAEMMKERAALMRQQDDYLLSAELYSASPEAVEASQRKFGDLPVEKLRQLELLAAEHLHANMEKHAVESARPATPGESRYTPPSREQYLADEAKRRAEIQALLTPEEYTQYQLRNSEIASMLRGRLAPFRATQEEYEGFFSIQQTLAAPFENGATVSREESVRLQSEAEAKIQALLGPERYADYAELQKGHGDKLPRLMARLDLPLATMGAITAVRDHTNAQLKTIQNDPALTTAERATQIAALARDARENLTLTLGDEGLSEYTAMKGDWLRNLDKAAQPRP